MYVLHPSIPSPMRNNSGAPEVGHLTPDGSGLSALSATPTHNLGTHRPNIYLYNLRIYPLNPPPLGLPHRLQTSQIVKSGSLWQKL